MPTKNPMGRRRTTGLYIAIMSAWLSGCSDLSTGEQIAVTGGIVAGSTLLGGQAPTHEIEQIYYLGVFDPQDQLPPSIYRVRVRGQSSFLSSTQFASGWVPASSLDSLGVGISFDEGRVKIEKTEDDDDLFKTGRRLMMFGPEGFREAPANHRLVIVMGASPEAFFSAIDESLGVIAQVTQEQGSIHLDKLLFRTLIEIRSDRQLIESFISDVHADLPAQAVSP